MAKRFVSAAPAREGRVAVVVGASGKIGPAIACTLHAAGFSVVAHCSRNTLHMDGLVERLNSIRPNSSVVVTADFRPAPDVAARQVVDVAVAQFQRLDALVHAASLFGPADLKSMTIHEWHDNMNVNAASALFLAQHALPHLLRTRGAIVHLCDVNAERPLVNHIAYNASKAALIGLTKSLAKDLASHGIRVNGINPGAIGPWVEGVFSDTLKDDLIRSTPLGRFGTPEAVADAVLFLLRNDFVTGQIVNVDGGMTLNLRITAGGGTA
eukprot:GGOE01049973.1.p1 GENE.GGOE01049973.1~~GGOE01049973.1.p1  ORF type:complete len:279 (+),score=60.50 GGOE01049973.1:34-837(+)